MRTRARRRSATACRGGCSAQYFLFGPRCGKITDLGGPMSQQMIVHRGGCHCGRVRFEVDAPAQLDALDCNCSICRMTGFLHLIVPASRFRLVAGADALTEYTFNTGAAKHRFCRHCGIKGFYVPRSNPDGVEVNVRCIDDGTIESVRLIPFDDGDRERGEAAIAHLSSAD
jgi:hypothetical protein